MERDDCLGDHKVIYQEKMHQLATMVEKANQIFNFATEHSKDALDD